jgi:hypothetical protein
MYLVVRSYEHTSALYNEEGYRQVSEQLVPRLSEIEGFVSYYSAFDPTRATITSVSIYETREGAEAANRMAEEWGSKNMSVMGTVNPTAWAGAIVIAVERPAG